MEYRKVCEITPWCCPPGGPGNCIGCGYFIGIETDPCDNEFVEVLCRLDENQDEMEEE